MAYTVFGVYYSQEKVNAIHNSTNKSWVFF